MPALASFPSVQRSPRFRRSRAVAIATAIVLLGASISLGAGPRTASAAGATAEVGGVVSGGGAPLASVDVEILSLDGSYSDDQETIADGTFDFTGVPAGSYTLQFTPEDGVNFLPQWWDGAADQPHATYFPVAAGDSLDSQDATLTPGATISGSVDGADALGTGIPDIDVAVYSLADAGSSVGEASTDDQGDYSVIGLPAGQYAVHFVPDGGAHVGQWWNDKLSFATADTVTLDTGGAASDVDAHLALGATISGTVSRTGDVALAHAEVNAFNSDHQIVASAETNAAGDYTLEGLDTGSYRVLLAAKRGENYAPQYWKNASTFAKATVLPVTVGNATTGIDAVLGKGSSISGTVYKPGTGKKPETHAVATLFAASGGEPLTNVIVNSHGKYLFTALAAGKYSVQIEPEAAAHAAIEWWGGSFTEKGAKSLTVGAGASRTGINQKLVTGATVSGLVKVAGKPTTVPYGVDVTLWSSDQKVGHDTIPPFERFTNKAGKYSFANIGPGTYTLQFSSESGLYVGQWWKNKRSQATATKLVVKLNKARTGIDATLTPAP